VALRSQRRHVVLTTHVNADGRRNSAASWIVAPSAGPRRLRRDREPTRIPSDSNFLVRSAAQRARVREIERADMWHRSTSVTIPRRRTRDRHQRAPAAACLHRSIMSSREAAGRSGLHCSGSDSKRRELVFDLAKRPAAVTPESAQARTWMLLITGGFRFSKRPARASGCRRVSEGGF